MILRAATLADTAQLFKLYSDLHNPSDLGSEADLAQVLEHPGTQVRCAEENGTLAAMLTLHVLPNVTRAGRPYALVENVVTRVDRRGEGIGRAVMQDAVKVAAEAGVYKLMLLTAQSRTARIFYEKLGFSADEKWGMSLRL